MACGKCNQYDCICDINNMKEQLRIKQMETELLQFKIAARQNPNTVIMSFLQNIKKSIYDYVQLKYSCGPVSREMDIALEIYNFIVQALKKQL